MTKKSKKFMVENLLPLYEVLASPTPTNEDMQRVTESLQQLYQNPEMIPAYFEVINTNSSDTYRGLAATSLNSSIRMHWENIIQNVEFKEQIKITYLQILTKEQNMRNRSILLQSMSPIFMTELGEWPEFLQFLQSISADPQYYFIALSECFENLPFQAVGEFFNPICQLIENVFAGTDSMTIKCGAELLKVMFIFLSAEPEAMIPLYQSLTNCISVSLSSNADYTNHLINSLTNIIENAPQFCEPAELLTPLFQFAQNDEILASTRVLLIDPITACIRRYQDQLVEVFPDCIALSVHLGKLCYDEDECFDNQQNSFFATILLENLVEFMDPNDFFEEFWANYDEESEGCQISFACGLISFIEYIPNVVALHFKDITQFSVGLIQNPHHCFQEAGISVLMELIGRVSEPISDFSDTIIQSVINVIESDEEKCNSILNTALSFLVEFFYVIPISSENLAPLFEKIVLYTRELPITYLHLTISCLAALVSSSKSETAHFAAEILPIVIEAAQVNSEDSQLVQSAAIEALSQIIRYSPESVTEVYESAIKLFTDACMQTNDIQMYSSSILAFKNIVIHKTPLLEQVLPSIIQRTLSILSIDTDDRTPGDETSSMSDARQASCEFLAELVKFNQEVTMPFLPNLSRIAARLVDYDNDDVSIIALKLAVRIAHVIQEVPAKLIAHLLKGMQSQKQSLVVTGFKGFHKLIAKNVPTVVKGQEVLDEAIRNGFAFFEGGLLCQHRRSAADGYEEDQNEQSEVIQENNVDLKDAVFAFFATLAQYRPQDFPLDMFWKYAESTTENPETHIECIGVLTEFYAVAHENLPPVYKTAIRNAFFTSLQIVDFSRPPHPFAAIRCLIEVQGGATQEELEMAVQVCENVLETENEGQLYYWPTVAATVSLLFTLIRVCGQMFEWGQFLERMLPLAPRCLVEAESENIISSILSLPKNIQQTFIEQIVEVIKAALDRGVKKGITPQTAANAQAFLAAL